MTEIVAIRTQASDDETHSHLELVGYASPHIDSTEAIFIPIPRLLQRSALGEKFAVSVNGEMAEISSAKCPVCGHEPYLKTAKDSSGTQMLLALPER